MKSGCWLRCSLCCVDGWVLFVAIEVGEGEDDAGVGSAGVDLVEPRWF